MSTPPKCCDTKDLPKGVSAGKTYGAELWFGPGSCGASEELLVALPLVQPVLRSCQILRPVVQVQLAAPGAIGLILLVGELPREISTGFPGAVILLAHRVLHLAWRRTMRHHSPKRRAGVPRFSSLEYSWQVAGPLNGHDHWAVRSISTEWIFRGGPGHPSVGCRLTCPGRARGGVLQGPRVQFRLLRSFGTWRSPVAHCNGVAGVAGSNPAVPIESAAAALAAMSGHSYRQLEERL
jgi:hypothetical protein